MKQKIILLKGLPASGKTTFAKELCEKDSSYVRINKDDIRAMLGGEWSKEQEKLVLDIRDENIKRVLISNKNVIIDDTNYSPKHQEKIQIIIDEFNETYNRAKLEVKEFNTPIWECIKRDALRPNPVGKKVIWEMYNRYLAPAKNKKKSEWIQEKGKPKAIIVDIDGTLAHMNNRTPFDYTKVKDDYCDVVIKDIVMTYQDLGFDILFVSGRDDSCRTETLEWLGNNMIVFKALFMRKTGDKRHDWEVKKEIYQNEIEPFYSVFFCLDDRDQIVKMWRELGLKCLQCEFGDF